MKTLSTLLLAGVLLLACASPAQAREPVSLDVFYDNLEPYGSWREVGDYGYCWQPRDVDRDWRPYSDGRWVYSDAGWTWDSDEPYGWAVYHYGRWADVEDIGWIWIPGTEWGPGWVSWRHSPRYVGWAPLPPEALFLRGVGLSAWVDDYYDIGPSSYRFVEGRNFGARRMGSVFVDQRQNITIINETTNITNITYEGDFVHNGGLRFDQQSRLSEEPLRRYKLDRRQDFDGDARHQTPDHLRSRINGDSLSMMAPSFQNRASSAPRKLSEKLGKVDVNRGWKNSGSSAQMDEAREHMKSKIRAPEQLPPRAKQDRPDDRKPNDNPRTKDRPPEPMDQGPKGKPRPPGISADPKRLPSEPETKPRINQPQRPDANDSQPKEPQPRPEQQEKPKAPEPRKEPKREEPQSKPMEKRPEVARPEQRPDRKPEANKPEQRPDRKPEAQKSQQRPDNKPESNKPEQRPQSKPEAQAPRSGKGQGKPDEKRKKKDD